jgi:hypothetical protein
VCGCVCVVIGDRPAEDCQPYHLGVGRATAIKLVLSNGWDWIWAEGRTVL